MWEATLDPAYADEAAAALVAEAGPWTAREVYRSLDRPSHLVVISHWADPAAERAAVPPAAVSSQVRVWHFNPAG
jgi:quinol monooxygenase YgiN